MPRQPRYPLVGIPQYVIQRGHNRQAIFFADADYARYLALLKIAGADLGCRVHAYALMPNQAHLLISPLHPNALAKAMQSVGQRYVRYVNDAHRRTGTLWEGRYKACPIDAERYLLACYRYIELGPVRSGVAAHAGAYPWSSYGHHAQDRIDALISDHDRYLALGPTPAERCAAYGALFSDPLDDAQLSAIGLTANQCLVLGSEQFKDQIERTLARKVRHGKAGRPRKEIEVRP